MVREQLVERRELTAAAGETNRVWRQLVRDFEGCCPGGAERAKDVAVEVDDAAMQPLEVGTWIGAQRVGQVLSDLLVAAQSLSRPAGVDQSREQPRPERLT